MQVRLELQIKLYNFVYIINLNHYNYEEIKSIVDVCARRVRCISRQDLTLKPHEIEASDEE